VNVAFRTDASTQIGTGHVMRCLTLADALHARGAECRFFCREQSGDLLDLIRHRGHEAIGLPGPEAKGSTTNVSYNKLDAAHAAWLGVDWRTDAEQTSAALGGKRTDWLVIDHYALDARWESALKAQCGRLLVIDDLADRKHICDLLLDQNLIEGMETRYEGKVPTDCTCLIGPHYTLLRPEFKFLRPVSLARRKSPILDRLLVFMGGGDFENETGKVVAGIKLSKRRWRHIDVVVGQGFPSLHALKESLENFPSATLHIQTPHMATLMAAADLAVTAGGSITWEKCALGLPSLVAILAENQREIATKMHKQGAQRTMGVASEMTPCCYARYLDETRVDELPLMIARSSVICDASGIEFVLQAIESFCENRNQG
jgi:UDP-2,4-diacetamido-2,4,6-trideoxy-beta-L-altropyranose hydrolase